jgi:N-acetylglucosamine-6-phosphate deacetylase
LYCIPGLIDIHVHGSAGYEFSNCTIEALDKIAQYLIKEGVTSFLPTTFTVDEKLIKNMCKAAGEYTSQDEKSEVIGVHIEGPFISKEKCGAQNSNYIKKPDTDFYKTLQKLSGNKIKIITIAPDIEGAMEFITRHHREVICSIAHSTADYQTAQAAFACGASHVTHLFNGMPPFLHRNPGIVGAALDSSCMVELISDGNLVCPTVIRAAFKMFGDDRIILISDGTSVTGGKEKKYIVDGRSYIVKDQVAQMEDGTLVGPIISLRECIKKLVKDFGIPIESAVKCATYNPAKQLNILDEYGVIKEGNYADLLLFDEDFNVKKVFKKGRNVSLF